MARRAGLGVCRSALRGGLQPRGLRRREHRQIDLVERGNVIAQDGLALFGLSDLHCSASISWDHGQVESECGKSLAHISRRQFIWSADRNATQSSWKVV